MNDIAITQNTILNGRIKIWQPTQGYRSGLDAILLAAFARGNGHIIEAGCGVGTVMCAVAQRCQNAQITGIEIQENLIPITQKNIDENNFNTRLNVLHGDIRHKKIVPPHCCDEMIMNPPYVAAQSYTGAHTAHKNISHSEGGSGATLDDWIDFANYAIKPKGILSLIHRADRLTEILSLLNKLPFGNIEIFPLWPKTGQAAKRVLIRAIKDNKAPMILQAGFTLHQENGDYTKEIENIMVALGGLD